MNELQAKHDYYIKLYQDTGRKAYLDRARKLNVDQYIKSGGKVTILPAKEKPRQRPRESKSLHDIVKRKSLTELIVMLQQARLEDIENKYF